MASSAVLRRAPPPTPPPPRAALPASPQQRPRGRGQQQSARCPTRPGQPNLHHGAQVAANAPRPPASAKASPSTRGGTITKVDRMYMPSQHTNARRHDGRSTKNETGEARILQRASWHPSVLPPMCAARATQPRPVTYLSTGSSTRVKRNNLVAEPASRACVPRQSPPQATPTRNPPHHSLAPLPMQETPHRLF